MIIVFVSSHPVHSSPLLLLSLESRASPASRRRTAQAGTRKCPRSWTHRERVENASEQPDRSSRTHFQSHGGDPASKYPSLKKASWWLSWDASPTFCLWVIWMLFYALSSSCWWCCLPDVSLNWLMSEGLGRFKSFNGAAKEQDISVTPLQKHWPTPSLRAQLLFLLTLHRNTSHTHPAPCLQLTRFIKNCRWRREVLTVVCTKLLEKMSFYFEVTVWKKRFILYFLKNIFSRGFPDMLQ